MSHVSERSSDVQGLVQRLKYVQGSLKKATEALERFQFGDVVATAEATSTAAEGGGGREQPVRVQGGSRGESGGGGLLFRGSRWRPVSAFRTTS